VKAHTVVVGLGNPVLADDGVGIAVARALAPRLTGSGIAVTESSWGGMRFLDLLAGFDRAVLVDAIQWRRGPVGTVYCLTPEEAIPTVRASGYHDISLGQALALGAKLDIPLPRSVVVFAVEVADATTVREGLSPAVAAAVPEVIEDIEDLLAEWGALEAPRLTRR
jgi:hydrogenase maturation protease